MAVGLDFPSDWKMMTIENCMSAIIDYRGKSPQKTSWGIPLVTAKIVKDGRILPPAEYIAPEDYVEWMRRGVPQKGDVVITTEAPLGEVAQLDGRKVALAQRLITLRGKSGVLDNYYLKYALQSVFVQRQLKARETGTTVNGIRQSELRKIKLPIPVLAEQKAISHILGTLDDKIELNRRMNETLEAMAKAIFKSWFVDFDPVRAKAEGRQSEGMDADTTALFPDSFEQSKIGEIPEGWDIKDFDQIVEILSGGTPKTSIDAYWHGDISWFTVKDAPLDSDIFVLDTEKHITQDGVDNSVTKILPFGTTIISARGTVGKLAMVGRPMAMNQTCYGLKGKTGYPDPYIYFQTKALVEDLKQKTHGCVFDTIIRDTFKMLHVASPPPDIVNAFSAKAEPILQKVLNNLIESRTLAAIRDALLPKLLSGEVRVKDAEKIAAGAGLNP